MDKSKMYFWDVLALFDCSWWSCSLSSFAMAVGLELEEFIHAGTDAHGYRAGDDGCDA